MQLPREPSRHDPEGPKSQPPWPRRALANRLIHPDNMQIVIVGDEAVLREELEALGMPIKRLDEDGFEIE